MPPAAVPPASPQQPMSPVAPAPSLPPKKKKWPFFIGGAVLLVVAAAALFILTHAGSSNPNPQPQPTPTSGNSGSAQYLIFQSFWGVSVDRYSGGTTDNAEALGSPPPWDQSVLKGHLEKYIADVQNKLQISTITVAPGRYYGFATGPLTLDQTDQDLRDSIKTAFDVAIEKKVALVIHFDITHYWKYAKNADGTYLADSRGAQDNREWKDWRGTIADKDPWDGVPGLMPTMCFECTQVKALVDHKATEVIAPAIQEGLDRLQAAGESDLFGGVIVGWEAGNSIGVGYHALTVKGYSSSNPPANLNQAAQQVLHDYLQRWTKALADSGVPKEKIYTHTAAFAPDQFWIPFTDYSNAGYSIYPGGAYDQIFQNIWAEAKKHGGSWAEAEGTNVSIGSVTTAGQATGLTWETYLGSIFNHGGTLANVFGGFLLQPADGYTKATESVEAVAAYQKFLRGETLTETAAVEGNSLPDKVQRALREMQAWGPTHQSQLPAVQKMFETLTAQLNANDLTAAEKTVDAILAIVAAH